MTKRKRRERDARTDDAASRGEPTETRDAPDEGLPPPDPPQPNLPLLVASGILYAAWLGFLVWMALAT